MNQGLIKILHIYDDDKITETSIRIYQELNKFPQNFIILSDSAEKWQQLTDQFLNVSTLNNSSENEKKLLQLINEHDVVYFHPLSFQKAKIIAKIKKAKQLFIWVVWGYDLYNFLDALNSNKNYKTELQKNSIINWFRNFYTFKIIYKKAIRKIDFCYFLLEGDYLILKENFENQAVWISNIYPTIEYYLKNLANSSVSNNKILIGNSATPSNLHSQVFDCIDSNIQREIICPLNYGDQNYKKLILEEGKIKFGDYFNPLVDFIPLKDYMSILENCSHAIMPHERQQAFGTIVIMLFLGAKVFLSEKSTLYPWFEQNNIKIYSFEKDLKNEIDTFMDEKTLLNNKKNIEKVLSIQTFIEKENTIQENFHKLLSF
jgi:dTDP-N-acetylfucosamine:lipid II N-acetylfucosaminyltransferase